jgi:hypothetical protein
MTFGLDYLLWGMTPSGYHLTNTLFHSATALACYFLSLRLLRAALQEVAESDLRIGAALAALLFAVHPLRAESVAWITERRDVVSGLFYLLSVIAYLKAVDGTDRVRPRWYWTSVGLFACGLLSKSIVVSLPIVLLALDVYPLDRLGGARGWRRPSVWLEKVPYVALGTTAAVIGFFALFTLGNTRSLAEMGPLYRTVLSIHGLAFYLWKSVMPFALSPLYPLDVTVTWLHFGAAAALLGIAIFMRRRWPAFTVATLVYLATLLPVLGIFQNGPQAAADRYTYLACLGWVVILGGLAARRWAGRAVASRGALDLGARHAAAHVAAGRRLARFGDALVSRPRPRPGEPRRTFQPGRRSRGGGALRGGSGRVRRSGAALESLPGPLVHHHRVELREGEGGPPRPRCLPQGAHPRAGAQRRL